MRCLPCRRLGMWVGSLLCGCLGAASVSAQVKLPGQGLQASSTLFPNDLAILDSGEPRNAIRCSAAPLKPTLGFDFRFHSGYQVDVPFEDVAGSRELVVVFRVSSQSDGETAVYFAQHFEVPALSSGIKGDAHLEGAMDLGAGAYRIDWLMRDGAGRVCSSYWNVTASLSAKDKDLRLDLPAGAVEAPAGDAFRPQPPIARREARASLRVNVLLDIAPEDEHIIDLEPDELNALIAALRHIDSEPRVASIAVTAFNWQQRRVFYRQTQRPQIDFPALGQAVRALHLGTIDVAQLAQKDGEAAFLKNLVTSELSGPQAPDLVIFIGPKVYSRANVRLDSLPSAAARHTHFFYLNYVSDRTVNPWRDAIGSFVHSSQDGQDYVIQQPRDIQAAWRDILSRLQTEGRLNQPNLSADRVQ